jgi:hypothetical protein
LWLRPDLCDLLTLLTEHEKNVVQRRKGRAA